MTAIISDRRKLPAFFSITWTFIWCAAGSLFLGAALSGSRYEYIWIAGLVLILAGALTARNYFSKAPSLRIEEHSLFFGNRVYLASDIASVRHESESRWNWVRIWNVFAVVIFILAIILIIASMCGEGGGEGLAGISDIFLPDRPAKANEVMILRFRDGSTRRILSSMYHNYYQLREAIHAMTWSTRPRL